MGETMGDSVFDVVGELLAGYRLADVLESVVAGELSKEDAAAAIGTDMDPEIRKRAEDLLTQALATHHIDWQRQREKEARAEERRLPSGYLSRFFEEAVAFAGGRVEKRLDGTLRVTRSPDNLVARSRLAGATRKIAPSYERLTFDKSVAMRPPTPDDDPGAPVAELCGPGHPLFDALVGHAVDATRSDLAAGAVFEDPSVSQPLLLHFLTGDSIDGNNELVHRSFASAAQTPAGFDRNRSFLYDLVPHAGAVPPAAEPIAEADMAGWARQHIFETRYLEAVGERQEVATIQESFLRRSFVAMLARADMALVDLEQEVSEGRQGAEGRLRQAELAKAQLQERRDRRIAETERGKQVRRGPVRLLGSALVIPAVAQEEADDGESKKNDDSAGLSKEAIEQVAIRVSWKFEEDRGVDFLKSVEADNIGFDLLSVKEIERRCIEVKGRAGVGMASLSWSEFAKAIELGDDYWLYLVLDCATPSPRLCRVQNPAKSLADHWKPDLNVQYKVSPDAVIAVSEGR